MMPRDHIGWAENAALIAAVCFVLVLRKLYLALTNPLSRLPGPKITLWTNLILKYHTLRGNRMQYIDSLFVRYGDSGPIVRISPTEVGINSPDAVTTIQKTAGGFGKSAWYDKTGPGLIGMRDREKHSRRRRLLAHPLSNTSLVGFEPLIQAKVDLMLAKLAQEHQSVGYADVYKWFHLMATDIIGDLTFGSSFQMLEQGRKSQYVLDLEAVMPTVHARIELGPLFEMARYLPLPATKEVSKRFERILDYGKQSMHRLKLARKSGFLEWPTFFDRLMASKDKEDGLSELEMEEEAAEFMVTGTDTTSNTLTYTVWAVLSHPSVREKLEAEVASLPPNYRDTQVQRLEYLQCVVQEGLRLYGAASGSHSRDVPKGGWEVGGWFVPSTATVLTQSFSLHRLPDVFPRPYSFEPERWLSSSAEMRAAFIPFGGGPRRYMELRLAVTAFFRVFRGAQVHSSMMRDDMALENYTLISPKGRKCLVTF